MTLIDKLPWREGFDIYESRIPQGAPELWSRVLSLRWLPLAGIQEFAPALERAAIWYWAGRTIGRLGRQAVQRPVNWGDRNIIWLLGLIWEHYGETCGTASNATSKFEGFVHDAIMLIEPGRRDLPGRQAFRTTKTKRPHLSDL